MWKEKSYIFGNWKIYLYIRILYNIYGYVCFELSKNGVKCSWKSCITPRWISKRLRVELLLHFILPISIDPNRLFNLKVCKAAFGVVRAQNYSKKANFKKRAKKIKLEEKKLRICKNINYVNINSIILQIRQKNVSHISKLQNFPEL